VLLLPATNSGDPNPEFSGLECGCFSTLKHRQEVEGDWSFHEEECEEGFDVMNEAIVRLWDGKYAHLAAHGFNPRDYHGAAIWLSTSLNGVLTVDVGDAYIR